jgi:ribosome maturation factor RimP
MWGRFPTFFYSQKFVKSELEAVVESALDALGFDLVDLRRGGSRSRPVVEIRIDRRDGEKVTVEDCARASRALEAHLDNGELGDRYELQVSSPGMDRPLKLERDWRRFVGRQATVKSALLGGRREVEIVGVEGSGEAFVVVVRDLGGKGQEKVEYRLPLSGIDEARLAFHWNR